MPGVRGAALAIVLATMPVAAASSASAQAPATHADPALAMRLAELVAFLNGRGSYDALFAPVFQQAVPAAQFATYAQQLHVQGGSATGVDRIDADTPFSGTATIAYSRATVTVEVALDPASPHRIAGLRITGAVPRGDSFARLEADFRALHGQAGFAVYALGDGAPRPVATLNADAAAPIGSAFKLWVLAEAARQVAAGTRTWADVLTLGPRSIPSGILQDWPANAPVTLQTLATLMISISDNTAADTLLTALGRDRVGAMVAAIGVADPDRTLPLLTTGEAFALKTPANAAIEAAWATADRNGRTALLEQDRAALASTPLDPRMFGTAPLAIDRVEWFGSPADMARTLDWLRVHGGATPRAILAIDPGVDRPTAARFAYIGYKGGSEPGVASRNYLVEDKAGRWFAVTGNWHDAQTDVDGTAFGTLMIRALLLAAGG